MMQITSQQIIYYCQDKSADSEFARLPVVWIFFGFNLYVVNTGH